MHCMQINLTAVLHSFYNVNTLANGKDKRQQLYAATSQQHPAHNSLCSCEIIRVCIAELTVSAQ